MNRLSPDYAFRPAHREAWNPFSTLLFGNADNKHESAENVPRVFVFDRYRNQDPMKNSPLAERFLVCEAESARRLGKAHVARHEIRATSHESR